MYVVLSVLSMCVVVILVMDSTDLTADYVFVRACVQKTIWYEYADLQTAHRGGQTLTVTTPLNFIPVYLRGGSIVTRRDRPRRASPMMERDPFTIVVALDSAVRQKYLCVPSFFCLS